MTVPRQILILLAAGGLLGSAANLLHRNPVPWIQDWSRHIETLAARHEIKVIPLHTVLRHHRNRSTLFIDARPPAEFEAGHIPGATSLPLAGFDPASETVAGLLFADLPLIFYCSGLECDDALNLALRFKESGAEALFFSEGLHLWQTAGNPIEKGAVK